MLSRVRDQQIFVEEATKCLGVWPDSALTLTENWRGASTGPGRPRPGSADWLTNVEFHLGMFPRQTARGVTVPKPGKDDYA